ncbi:MAG: PhnD/SsuA/transferrin family substrate-binding protein [Bryobacterales bacterium]|nr:PhnD/SsuA/transferrin family substrate-binding protein [Bryobacterales bacterium]
MKLVFLSVLLSLQPAGGQSLGPKPLARLHTVASAGLVSAVNRNDASLAIKTWFELLGGELGLHVDSRIDMVEEPERMLGRLRQKSADALVLDVFDYLWLEPHGFIQPVLIAERSGKAGARSPYVLLAPPGDAGVADLRGKILSHYSRGESNMGIVWLEVALAEAGLGRSTSFFAAIKPTAKPQECVHSLFFAKVDACLVDEANFNLLKEMNPQLARLRVIARSAPLVEMVIALPVIPHPYQRKLVDTALSLHHTPRGKQLLMVFKAARLAPASSSDLDSARALWAAHRKVRDKSVPAIKE